MSIEFVNKVKKLQGLKPTEKYILHIMADYADEKGSCYPSHSHIAQIVGLQTTKSVKVAIKKFVELGLVVVKHRKKENGGCTSNRYFLNPNMVTENLRVLEETTPSTSKTYNTKDNTKDIYSEKFEIFWRIYPRKIAKKSAYKSWSKFDEKHYDKILYGAQRFAEQSQKTEEKYIPHATTWLNQERWLDFFETDKYGCVIKAKPKKKINNLAG